MTSLTHVLDVQGVDHGPLELVAGDGSLERLLLYNLVALLILHLGIFVIGTHPHYLFGWKEESCGGLQTVTGLKTKQTENIFQTALHKPGHKK